MKQMIFNLWAFVLNTDPNRRIRMISACIAELKGFPLPMMQYPCHDRNISLAILDRMRVRRLRRVSRDIEIFCVASIVIPAIMIVGAWLLGAFTWLR